MRIIIATDGSSFSRAAIDEAAEMLRHVDGLSINIVSVFEPPAPIATEPFVGVAEYYQGVLDSVKQLAEQNAAEARDTVQHHFPKASVTVDVAMGNPSQVIVACAEEWTADLIVVGSHGRGFWSRALLGSVSDGVVHHAPCSVLVVRSQEEELPS